MLHEFSKICSLGLLVDIVHQICLNEILQYFNNLCRKEQNTVLVLCTSCEPWFPSLPAIPYPVVPSPSGVSAAHLLSSDSDSGNDGDSEGGGNDNDHSTQNLHTVH